MAPFLLLIKIAFGALISLQVPGSDGVRCFNQVNNVDGKCEGYLGDRVSEDDCCLNIKYGFQQDENAACQACRPAEWSVWSDWSMCTVPCLEGVQSRHRLCIGKGNCSGDEVETRICSLQECCPVMGGWSTWSAWSQCSVTCHVGQTQRTRECNNPSPVCGGTCIGDSKEITQCDTQQVCPTHGAWGNWGAWNDCSFSCIKEGSTTFPVQVRRRVCNNPSPSESPPGRACEGNEQEARDCTSAPICPVDGGWGAWQHESECSVTCGVGQVREKRFCNNPAPRHGGRNCAGPLTQHIICNTKLPCPIDGRWSSWEEWKPCARADPKEIIKCTNRVGFQSRRRSCLGQQFDGIHCGDDYKELRPCYNLHNCIIKGNWSEWTEWGLCSSPCGQSETKRYRECLPNYPNYPMKSVLQTKEKDVVFFGTPKVICSKLNGQFLKVEEKRECNNVPACT
ncbi:properdin-like [Mixophyes fleayi]|uniref:properdin-like n=1 Tax=Mixophyes fleayi TaxID=3061075 RepID=UPI003F4E03E8